MRAASSLLAVLVHGGAGNDKRNEDGCASAARRGFELLESGADALEAAVAAVVVLEDDERFNAGTGSILRVDGSIETDAAVMDSSGRIGAVAALRGIRNPVRIAAAVAEIDHWMLAGEGARSFALERGFEQHSLRGNPAAAAGDRSAAACDTVGAVAIDRHGRFAVASSTGGSAPALPGRVGDTPIPGCGFWVGPLAAVAATGVGEHIVRHLLARTVYGWIERGVPLQQALDRGIALFPQRIDVGLVAVTASCAAVASNRDMPTCVKTNEPA